MSKLRDAWEKYQGSIIHGFADMEAAITEAEETIARLIRERDEAREVLKALVDEYCDYGIINDLGDPEKQHNIKRARAIGIPKGDKP